MKFKTISLITSVITFVLGAGYLFFGELILGRWQLEPSGSALLLGRRTGALYLGLSVMYFLARSAPVSLSRYALIAGTAAALLLLVILGIFDLTAGHAGNGLLVSIIIEFLLFTGYINLFFSERKERIL